MILVYVFAGVVGLALGHALHLAFLRLILRRMIVRRVTQVGGEIAEETRVQVLTRKITELEKQKGDLMVEARQLRSHLREFQSLRSIVAEAERGKRMMLPCPDCEGERIKVRTIGEDEPYYVGEPCPTCRGGHGFLTVRFD